MIAFTDNIEPTESIIRLFNAISNWLPSPEIFTEVIQMLNNITSLETQVMNSSSIDGVEDSIVDGCYTEEDVDDIQLERRVDLSDDIDISDIVRAEGKVSHGRYLSPTIKAYFNDRPLRYLSSIQDLRKLSQNDCVMFVFQTMTKYSRQKEEELKKAIEKLQHLVKKKKELDDGRKEMALASYRVIGMTVSGASIYHDILKQLRPGIILVEEAAETLEPQLVAAFGEWAKHVILIGDHEQLRPSVDSHRIAVKYHLDISMMERLVNNKYPHVTLNMQSRMRPEFAELLLDIYPDLKTNLRQVENNQIAKSIATSMFFWDTDGAESQLGLSYRNEEEAQRTVQLALFFICSGYAPEQITILAAYRSQVNLIRTHIAHILSEQSIIVRNQHDELQVNQLEVKTIDNFQGSENDFIVLSLVRNNPEGEVGYLRKRNRRCVAQSRARRGMYFIGHAATFKKNTHWRNMMHKLGDNVGKNLPIQCPEHAKPENIKYVSGIASLTFNGICNEPCDRMMTCEKHRCKAVCYSEHDHYKCSEYVTITCWSCDHNYKQACSAVVQPCMQMVSFQYADCHHSIEKCCSQMPGKCQESCSKSLTCGHPCLRKCGDHCDTQKQCGFCRKIRNEETKRRRKAEKEREKEIEDEIGRTIAAIRNKTTDTDLIEIDPDSVEYLQVSEKLTNYVDVSSCGTVSVKKIVQVYNTKVECQFLEKRKDLSGSLQTDRRFIGLSDVVSLDIDDIVANGLQLKPGEKNNMIFGTNIKLSGNLTSGSAELPYGEKRYLLCDILPGRTKFVTKQNVNEGMKSDALIPGKLFDSVCLTETDTEKTQNRLFIYDHSQVKVRYVVDANVENLPWFSDLDDLEKEALRKDKLMIHHIDSTREVRNDELDRHFRFAESQFHRVLQNRSCKQSYGVTSVDYYINPVTLRRFHDKCVSFRDTYGTSSAEAEIIATFHGTKASNAESIMHANFSFEKIVRGAYGKGIYFSEFPLTSLGYGDALLLCKVLPGRSYDCPCDCPGQMNMSDCMSGFDSHRVDKDKNDRGNMNVIFCADQILPMYRIHYSI